MDLKLGVFLDLATVDNGDLRLDELDRALAQWRIFPLTSASEVAQRIAGANVLVSNKVILGPEQFDQAPDLKLIVVAATGTNIIDLEAARARGIMVCNARDYCSQSVAQHVLGLMLNLTTWQPWYARSSTNGEWRQAKKFSLHNRPIRELSGLTLGIIGYGSLGKAVSDMARAIGMNVLIGERRGVKTRPNRLDFSQLVRHADIISVHCPLTEETRNMFDRDVMRAMKNDAILINTARGGIVNERDLADALRAGEIGGAGIDVLSAEPPNHDHALIDEDIPNLIVTPHNAWASTLARQECINQVTAAIRGFQRDQPYNRVV